MSPRPRTVPDEQILTAAESAMSRLGPARLTLAEVAKEAGLSPATLVQRFGSKRGLMLALWASAVDGVDACFEMLRLDCPSPLAAVLAGATMMSQATKSAEEMANHLAFLQMDVSDPEFHQHMLVLSRRTEDGYKALLDEAVTKREIVACDTRGLARAISAMAGGSLISWAIFREGTAEAWVRADLETLLAPYRAGSGKRRPRKNTVEKRRRRR
jgi:AcrR family transcriptional regulator